MSTTQDLIDQQGWSDETMLRLYDEFIAFKNLDDEFMAYLEQVAAEENIATRTTCGHEAGRDGLLDLLAGEPTMSGKSIWENNAVQFPRLLAEVAGIMCPVDFTEVALSMDLKPDELHELFDRAIDEWERIKKETLS